MSDRPPVMGFDFEVGPDGEPVAPPAPAMPVNPFAVNGKRPTPVPASYTAPPAAATPPALPDGAVEELPDPKDLDTPDLDAIIEELIEERKGRDLYPGEPVTHMDCTYEVVTTYGEWVVIALDGGTPQVVGRDTITRRWE